MKKEHSLFKIMKKVYIGTITVNVIVLLLQAFLIWFWLYLKNKKILDNNDIANIYIVILVLSAVILFFVWLGLVYFPRKQFLKKNYLSAKQEDIALFFSWKKFKTIDIKLGWLIFLKSRFNFIFWFSFFNLAFGLITAVIFDTI